MTQRVYQKVDISTDTKTLGLKLTGGKVGEQCFGIYIKRIIPGGAVTNCKSIQVGDQIIDVNGINVSKASLNRTINILRQASSSGHVSITFSSDSVTRIEFAKFINASQTIAQTKLRNSINSLNLVPTLKTLDINEGCEKCSLPPSKSLQDLEVPIEFKKSSAGIGFKVNLKPCSTTHTCCRQVSLLLIAAVTPGGDAAEDGRLAVGDYLTRINGHFVLQHHPNQVHSLLLREKLRPASIFQMSVIPGCMNPKVIADAIRDSRKFCQALPKSQENNSNPASLCTLARAHTTKDCPSRHSQSTSASVSKNHSLLYDALLLDGKAMVEVDKLYCALSNLGYTLNDDQYELIEKKLEKSDNNTVEYSNFVDAVLSVLHVKVSDDPLPVAESETKPLDDCEHAAAETEEKKSVDVCQTNIDELQNKISKLEKENQNLRDNIKKLESQHQQANETHESAIKQLKQDMEHMQFDYEELIKVLEAEIDSLQCGEVCLTKFDTTNDLQKQLSLVECECRKLNDSRDFVRSNTETLLAFTNKLVQADVKAFIKHNKSHEAIQTLENLAEQAENIYLEVRMLARFKLENFDLIKKFKAKNLKKNLQKEDLPYGWEEASLSDGRVYYIDHHTHTTSWTDPRKNVLPQANSTDPISSEIGTLSEIAADSIPHYPTSTIADVTANSSSASQSFSSTCRANMRLDIKDFNVNG